MDYKDVVKNEQRYIITKCTIDVTKRRLTTRNDCRSTNGQKNRGKINEME
jgi:hypothetical protein